MATDVEAAKMPSSKPTLSKSHGPTGFVVREAKEVLSLQKSGDHDREMPF